MLPTFRNLFLSEHLAFLYDSTCLLQHTNHRSKSESTNTAVARLPRKVAILVLLCKIWHINVRLFTTTSSNCFRDDTCCSYLAAYGFVFGKGS